MESRNWPDNLLVSTLKRKKHNSSKDDTKANQPNQSLEMMEIGREDTHLLQEHAIQIVEERVGDCRRLIQGDTYVGPYVRYNLGFMSELECMELKTKLEYELVKVRNCQDSIGCKEARVRDSYISDGGNGISIREGLSRNEVKNSRRRPGGRLSKQIEELEVYRNDVMQGNVLGKRKRKLNSFYSNSEFILGDDELVESESDFEYERKRSRFYRKSVNERTQKIIRMWTNKRSKLFSNCNNLLMSLSKHNHGWVFNSPVDAIKWQLVDYHAIIRYPMDLGTIGGKLESNSYKSPLEFAKDVRLTFNNAMLYNPKGHEVHLMAIELLGIFEQRWAEIKREFRFDENLKSGSVLQDVGPSSANGRKNPSIASDSVQFKVNTHSSRGPIQTGIVSSSDGPMTQYLRSVYLGNLARKSSTPSSPNNTSSSPGDSDTDLDYYISSG